MQVTDKYKLAVDMFQQYQKDVNLSDGANLAQMYTYKLLQDNIRNNEPVFKWFGMTFPKQGTMDKILGGFKGRRYASN